MFNFSMIDELARVMDRKGFQRLVDKVFVDGITWGRIVTLICVVGKAITKVGLRGAFFTIICDSVPKVLMCGCTLMHFLLVFVVHIDSCLCLRNCVLDTGLLQG